MEEGHPPIPEFTAIDKEQGYALEGVPITESNEARATVLLTIRVAARDTAYKRLAEKMAAVELLESPSDLEKPLVDRYKAHEDKVVESKKNCQWLFVTISPKPDVTLEQLVAKTKKCFQKKWFTDYILVFEQRYPSKRNPDIKLGDGYHVHFLVHRGSKTPSACKTEIQNTYKEIYAYKGCVIKLRTDKDVPGIKSYMDGCKDASKLCKSQNDKLWRANIGLENVYTPSNLQKLLDY